ncbi:SMI1/KNR4 family protein [Streptomyces sp. NBC_00727]|uniref:SMI1/KNR4 family protein n=1 Tax=Streptomyces sp. NBC_00727 TaxID=2903675 RepID=UPI00386F9020
MSMTDLARAAGLAEPRRYVVDWARVEAELGTRLPADYKEYVYWFGPGNSSDYFVVCVPGVENSNVEFMANLRKEAEDYRSWNAGNQRPPVSVPFFSDPGGRLPFLFTTEGCAVFWITDGDDPDSWKIGSRTRLWDVQRFEGGFTEFLREALWDTVELEAIPAYDDEPPLQFRPNDGLWRGGGGRRLEAYGSFLPTE